MGNNLHFSTCEKEFNIEEFGIRLIAKRKSAGFRSRDSFAKKYDELYNSDGEKSILESLKKYERGKSAPGPDVLMKICRVLGNCDAGFLLGLYDESEKTIHDIAALTGLSEMAVKDISNPLFRFNKETAIQPFLDALITSPYIQRLAFEFNQLETYRRIYQNSDARFSGLSDLMKEVIIDDEDRFFLDNPLFLKSADRDRMKYSEYLVFQCFTQFLNWFSEGGYDKGKEES